MSAAVSANPTWRIEFTPAARVKGALITLAFLAVFYNVVIEQAQKWWFQAADWGHGWVIPLFSVYLLNSNWEKIRTSPIRSTGVGLVLLLLGLALYNLTLWQAIPYGFVRPISMMITLLGIIVWLCGLPVLRYALVPWAYLFFAIPLPQDIYFQLTNPLAQLAGWVAVHVLHTLDVNLDIQMIGTTIQYSLRGIPGSPIQVADACAGMRATITLCALGVAIAYVSERPAWQRIVLVAACAPIAILSNLVRVVVTCFLHMYVDPKYAQGTWHTMLGLGTLMLAFLCFMLLSWVLSNLLVTHDTAGEGGAPASSSAPD
jgi:exosortase